MRCLWQFLLFFVAKSAANNHINLLHLAPITGPWRGGSAMNEAARMLVAKINADRTILPNFTLRIVPINAGCGVSNARTVVKLILRGDQVETYSYRSVYEWDTVTESFGPWSDEGFVGFIGPSCASDARHVTEMVDLFRKPLVSPSATGGDLADRRVHPYFWRTINNEFVQLNMYAWLAKALGLRKAAIFVTKADSDSRLLILQREFDERGIEAVGPGVPSFGKFNAFLMDGASMAEAEALGGTFLRYPARITILAARGSQARKLLCGLYLAGVRGVIILPASGYENDFIMTDDELKAEGTLCTSTQVSEMVMDMVFVGPRFVRDDLQDISVRTPCYGSDHLSFWQDYLSRVTATDATVDAFSRVFGATLPGEKAIGYKYGSNVADAVCMWSLALHEMLEVRQIPLSKLNHMSEEDFQTMQTEFGQTRFEGLFTTVEFPDKIGSNGLPRSDLKSKHEIYQVRSVTFSDGVSIAKYAHLGSITNVNKTLVVKFDSEATFFFRWASESLMIEGNRIVGACEEFKDCGVNETFDYTNNKCARCSAGRSYISVDNTCVRCPSGKTSRGGMECVKCAAGRYQNESGQIGCVECPAGKSSAEGATFCRDCAAAYTSSRASSRCTPCPLGTYGSGVKLTSCTDCPPLMSTRGTASTNISSCVCERGTRRISDGCEYCSFFSTSTELDAVECDSLSIGSWIAIGSLATCCPMLPIFVYILRRRFKRKHITLEATITKEISKALACIQRLSFPLVLIPLSDFVELGRFMSHEEARDAGKLLFLDAPGDIEKFKRSGKRYYFISHQWPGWTSPDTHDHQQYHAAVDCLLRVRLLTKRPKQDIYVWVDYISIPQRNSQVQTSAIRSLPVYASRANRFIILAPTVRHNDMGSTISLETYSQRLWCRTEFVLFYCHRGHERIYCCTTSETSDSVSVHNIEQGWVAEHCSIFSGSCTCCSRKHEGMDGCDKEVLVRPVLGMFAEACLLRNQSSTNREIFEFLSSDISKMLPAKFEFVSDDGIVSRPLFGHMAKWIRDHPDAMLKLFELRQAAAPLMKSGTTDFFDSCASCVLGQSENTLHTQTIGTCSI